MFLRKIEPGGSDRSFGIQVARLAGLPAAVVARAQEILRNLERTEFDRDGRPRLARSRARRRSASRQLPLFSSAEDGVLDELRRLDLDHLTPVQALACWPRSSRSGSADAPGPYTLHRRHASFARGIRWATCCASRSA